MKSIFLLSAILFSSFISGAAHAQTDESDSGSSLMNLDSGTISMAIECNFRVTTKFSCNDLKSDIFSFYTTVHRVDNPNDAAVVLSLSDEAGNAGVVNYTYSWKSKEETRADGIIDSNGVVYSLLLNQDAMDDLQMKSLLSTNVATGLNAFSKILSVSISDGKMTVSSEPKGDASEPGKETLNDRLAKSPFYMNVNVTGTFTAQGNKPYNSRSTYIGTTPEFAYLKNRYKVDVTAYYTNRKSSVPNGTGYTNSSVEQKGMGSVLVYSMSDNPQSNWRKWSVAVLNSVTSDPNSNIKLSTSTGVGMEYSVVPFRTTESKELAFRAGANYNTLKLGETNGLSHVDERFMSLFAKVYFYWVLDQSKFSITANAGVEENLKYGGYGKYSASGTLGYQLFRSTRLSGSVSYGYSPKSLTYPVNPDLSNPVQVAQMNGLAGKSLYLLMGLDFTIGNTKRKTRDRRWSTQ